jgi:hypothetical protein
VATRTERTPSVIGALQIVHRADAGQQQRGQHACSSTLGHAFDPVPVGVGAEAVVEAGALQAVAMRDFDGVDLGVVERLGDLRT